MLVLQYVDILKDIVCLYMLVGLTLAILNILGTSCAALIYKSVIKKTCEQPEQNFKKKKARPCTEQLNFPLIS